LVLLRIGDIFLNAKFILLLMISKEIEKSIMHFAVDTERFLEKSRNLESDESSPYYNGLDEYFFRALTEFH